MDNILRSCSKCGHSLSVTAAACAYCGAVVSSAESPPLPGDIEPVTEAQTINPPPLQADDSPPVLDMADELAQTLFVSGEMISVRAEVLRGIAKLLLEQPDLARTHLDQALLRFRRSSRLRSGLAADQWELLTQLVPDPERTADLAHLFDTGT